MNLPIATALLRVERDRLLREHYADGRSLVCADCMRLAAIVKELAAIKAGAK